MRAFCPSVGESSDESTANCVRKGVYGGRNLAGCIFLQGSSVPSLLPGSYEQCPLPASPATLPFLLWSQWTWFITISQNQPFLL